MPPLQASRRPQRVAATACEVFDRPSQARSCMAPKTGDGVRTLVQLVHLRNVALLSKSRTAGHTVALAAATRPARSAATRSCRDRWRSAQAGSNLGCARGPDLINCCTTISNMLWGFCGNSCQNGELSRSQLVRPSRRAKFSLNGVLRGSLLAAVVLRRFHNRSRRCFHSSSLVMEILKALRPTPAAPDSGRRAWMGMCDEVYIVWGV